MPTALSMPARNFCDKDSSRSFNGVATEEKDKRSQFMGCVLSVEGEEESCDDSGVVLRCEE